MGCELHVMLNLDYQVHTIRGMDMAAMEELYSSGAHQVFWAHVRGDGIYWTAPWAAWVSISPQEQPRSALEDRLPAR